jgi:hypothetical protein
MSTGIPTDSGSYQRNPDTLAYTPLPALRAWPMGFEHRRFECPKCNTVQNEVVASDPMKSNAVGWFSGELHPPS